jgi:hypothetical protein
MINKKSRDNDTEKDTDLSYLFGLSYIFQKIQNTDEDECNKYTIIVYLLHLAR